jgi:hypothetical protein
MPSRLRPYPDTGALLRRYPGYQCSFSPDIGLGVKAFPLQPPFDRFACLRERVTRPLRFAMPKRVFISYRRSEASKDARAVYERLRHDFGDDSVFLDREGIEPGEDFVDKLARQLDDCQVLLAFVGHDWVGTDPNTGKRRLDDRSDFVRIELTTALQRGIHILPVLINGATMPASSQLPTKLKPLARKQAVSLDFDNFEAATRLLVDAIRKVLHPSTTAEPSVSQSVAAAAGRKLVWPLTVPSFDDLKVHFMRTGLSNEEASVQALEHSNEAYENALSILVFAMKPPIQNMRA